jgi:hypothetical protein
VKAVTANPLLIEVKRQGEGLGLERPALVEGGVKTGHMFGIGQVEPCGLQNRQIGRLMQRSEGGKAFYAA